MRKPMLYVVAGIASLLLILGGWYFVRASERVLLSQFEEHKQQLREMRDAGKLPPELQGMDIDRMDLEHMAMRLPPGLEERLEVAHLFQSYWFVLGPLAVALCFGVAWVVGKMLPAGK
ncbi:MAG TPA: hypothetical protein VGP68_17650 [Gemmataceae bacterium]|jgi:hypothetical protein|nr:hypothetical protein [Gemmataceae bacterium]